MLNKTMKVIALLLFICSFSVFASGAPEKELLVPSDAIMVMGMDFNAVYTDPFNKELMAQSMGGALGTSDMEEMEEQFREELGLDINSIGKITVFVSSISMDQEVPELGINIQLLESLPTSVLEEVKESASGKELTYEDWTYYTSEDMDDLYFTATDKVLIFATTDMTMKKMLDVAAGKDDFSQNGELFSMYEEYKYRHFYLVGNAPADIMAEAEAPFNEIGRVKIGMDTGVEFILDVKADMGSEENAQGVVAQINMFIAMASQMMPPDNPEYTELVNQLIEPIKVESMGSEAALHLVYPKELLERAQALMMMMGGGMM